MIYSHSWHRKWPGYTHRSEMRVFSDPFAVLVDGNAPWLNRAAVTITKLNEIHPYKMHSSHRCRCALTFISHQLIKYPMVCDARVILLCVLFEPDTFSIPLNLLCAHRVLHRISFGTTIEIQNSHFPFWFEILLCVILISCRLAGAISIPILFDRTVNPLAYLFALCWLALMFEDAFVEISNWKGAHSLQRRWNKLRRTSKHLYTWTHTLASLSILLFTIRCSVRNQLNPIYSL